MPTRRDPDGDKIFCDGYYMNKDILYPKWMIFKPLICAWILSPSDDEVGDYH